MQFPINIGLRRSRFLDFASLLAGVLATAGALVFPVHWHFQAGMLLLIWGLLALIWWQLTPKIGVIRLEMGGKISMMPCGDSEFSSAELLPEAVVHPLLTIFRVRSEVGVPYRVLATVDSTNADSFRKLRVFLRWRARFDGSSGDAA